MAVTHGHGNPNWARDEVILALELYFECEGKIPHSSDARVQNLSRVLRSFPYHNKASRKDSFRNSDGIVFKLQNLRQLATGKGLANVSRVDREVWEELGHDPHKTKILADLIRSGVEMLDEEVESSTENDTFAEGRIVTETHSRRERNPNLRRKLLKKRRDAGELTCDICGIGPVIDSPTYADCTFEAHHIIPLSAASERRTKLADLALLCANCHRIIHRAIADRKRWISIEELKREILRIDFA